MFLRKDAYQPFNAAATTPGQKLEDSYSEQKIIRCMQEIPDCKSFYPCLPKVIINTTTTMKDP